MNRNYGQDAVSLAGNVKREPSMTTNHTPTPEQIAQDSLLTDRDSWKQQADHYRKRIADDRALRDELVAALKRAELTLSSLSSASVKDTNVRRAWEVVHAALAKVQEGTA